jgi:hypothetical protein
MMDIGILVLERIKAVIERRRCYHSRLIKIPDRISERPPRGGLSVSRRSFRECLLMALSVIRRDAPFCPLLDKSGYAERI